MTAFDDGVRHFNTQAANYLSEIIFENLSLQNEDFRDLLKLGAVYVNNERQTKDKIVSENSVLRVHTTPRRYNCDYNWNSLVVFENDFCLVLNKPSGVPSHPVVDNAVENALTQISLARRYPLFVTHRLDTLTSGLIVYGKKQSFVKSFNLQLQERSIVKKYAALVETANKLPARLIHYMNPAAGTPKKLSNQPVDGWALCELEITSQKQMTPELRHIRMTLLTGRTHQIRAQMSHSGAPIVGDALYGSKVEFRAKAIALRSCEIEFNCCDERLKFNMTDNF